MKGLRARLRALLAALLHEHTAPARLAAAVLVGCIVGCTPLFGLHFFVCVALAYALGLNKIVVYGAANLSIPPMVPLLGFASVQLGERLRHGGWLALRRGDFALANVRALAKIFFVDWMLGGVVLGAAIGLVAGAITWSILAARRARKLRTADAIGAAIDVARRRYDGLHARFKWYARMKYVMDPCYRSIAALVPPGAFVVDLGSGLGMLPVLMGLLGDGRRALGIEWDGKKVACGVHATRTLDGIEIVEGDARTVEIPSCDVITLVDMLHYWDAAVQRALLSRCRAALRPGGRLLVREGDPSRRGGARFTRAIEWIVTKLGWNRGPTVRFRPVAELRADLEALGFIVRIDEVAAATHPGNVLLVCDAT
ncbi:MAG: Glutamate synthase large chain [bacterium]|nr:Glutamate synthase large chain [bacterium]